MTNAKDLRNSNKVLKVIDRFGAASIDRIASVAKLDWMTVAYLLANPLFGQCAPTGADLWVRR